jgi:hypothetical protein
MTVVSWWTAATACVIAGCGFHPSAARDAPVGDAAIVMVPLTAWEISSDGMTWTATTLPNTNWGCSNCTRWFRTVVNDVPSSVEFEWASDNRARMAVNGTSAFSAYWLPNYCTDATCCGKCCDTDANCLANVSTTQTLDAPALGLFTSGPNTIQWEVGQEGGGSGFYVVMTLHY